MTVTVVNICCHDVSSIIAVTKTVHVLFGRMSFVYDLSIVSRHSIIVKSSVIVTSLHLSIQDISFQVVRYVFSRYRGCRCHHVILTFIGENVSSVYVYRRVLSMEEHFMWYIST